jgi:hypothetical protein
MVATATTANRTVNRVKPGDGKAHPVNHTVRIVVVRPAAGASAAPESHGSGHSHGLTKDQLEAAEEELKRMGAPPSSGGTAAAQESSAKMFDVLEPTDIVVVGRETASVRTVDSSGKPVSADATTRAVQTAPNETPTRRLFAHEHHYTDTVLPVWTGSDTIEYQCDVQFEIVKVEKAGWKIYGAPENPFEGDLPYRAEARPRVTDGARVWVWTSSVLPATANNQQYKMTFRIFDERGENGQDVDPDVVCGDPPPTP